MGRKKLNDGPQATLVCRLPVKIHADFKVLCKGEGRSMKGVAGSLVLDWMKTKGYVEGEKISEQADEKEESSNDVPGEDQANAEGDRAGQQAEAPQAEKASEYVSSVSIIQE
jgi:hypothetical protein